MANAQPTPGSELLALYKAPGMQDKYVLVWDYQQLDKARVSEVIVADTFAIATSNGISCITMSNACVMRTTAYGPLAHLDSTNILQGTALCGSLSINFLSTSTLVHDHIAEKLSAFRGGQAGGPNMLHYEGDSAIHELNKQGLGPPDDMDGKKK